MPPATHYSPTTAFILICLSLETWMDLLFSLGGTQVVDADFRRFNGVLLLNMRLEWREVRASGLTRRMPAVVSG
jgi:hypothetical protein